MREILIRGWRAASTPHTIIKGPDGKYRVNVEYRLADGTDVAGCVTADKKKEIPEAIKHREEAIAAQACAAVIMDDGTMGMLAESYTMNYGPGPSLIPEPRPNAEGYIQPEDRPHGSDRFGEACECDLCQSWDQAHKVTTQAAMPT